MKHAIIMAVLFTLILGCSEPEDRGPAGDNGSPGQDGLEVKDLEEKQSADRKDPEGKDMGTIGLMFDEEDLAQLEIEPAGEGCATEDYQAGERSPITQYTVCSFVSRNLDSTEVIVEIKSFSNPDDLNSTYQYESQHLRSIDGLLDEDGYGDQSRLYINHRNDYGGELTDPGITFYSLYICKEKFLIHITTKGSKEALGLVKEMGQRMVSKLG